MPRTHTLLAAALLLAPAACDAAAPWEISRSARAPPQQRLRASAEPPGGLCADDPSSDAADTETQPFLIVTSPRSGSTWMVEALQKLPCVQATHEMFIPIARKNPRIPHAVEDDDRLPALQSRSLRTFFLGEGMPTGRCEEVERSVAAAKARPHDVSFDLHMQINAMSFRCKAAEAFWALSSPACPGVPRAMGFKWMLNQRWKETLEANNYAAARFLASIGVRIVRLVRRDLVAQAVSNFSTWRTMRHASQNSSVLGAAHKASTAFEARILADMKTTIQPWQMVRMLLREQKHQREAEELFANLEKEGIPLDYVEVAYEDLIGDEGAGLRCAVKAFITRGGGRKCGSLAEAWKGSSYKIHKGRTSEYVQNWHAVSAEIFEHQELRPLLRNDVGARDQSASEAALASIVARDPAIARSCDL